MSDYLPPEALIEILSKLPLKSILRFRCVCKSWRSLISTPHFISKHFSISTANKTTTPSLLIRHFSHTAKNECFSLHSDSESFEKLQDLNYPCPTRLEYYFRCVGSCNGLICLTDDYFGITNTIILWNPSIRKSLTLPLPKFNRLKGSSFVPPFSSCGSFFSVLGFGYDLKTKVHKLVRVSYSYGNKGKNRFRVPPGVEIYSLREQSWRVFEGIVPEFLITEYFWSQVYMNGCVHWVGYKRVDHGTRGCLVYFDLGDEVFGEMELPGSLVHERRSDMVVSVMGDSLTVFVNDSQNADWKVCTVWVMKEYGVVDSWSKAYEIENFVTEKLVLGSMRNGDLLLVTSNFLESYNPKSHRTKPLGLRGSQDSFWVGNYLETLFLLEDGSEGDHAFLEGGDRLKDWSVQVHAHLVQSEVLGRENFNI